MRFSDWSSDVCSSDLKSLDPWPAPKVGAALSLSFRTGSGSPSGKSDGTSVAGEGTCTESYVIRSYSCLRRASVSADSSRLAAARMIPAAVMRWSTVGLEFPRIRATSLEVLQTGRWSWRERVCEDVYITGCADRNKK